MSFSSYLSLLSRERILLWSIVQPIKVIYSLLMSYIDMLPCTNCKRQIVLTHRYCCDIHQHFCATCSVQECSRCHQRRSKILYKDIFEEKVERTKIIKCCLCMDYQQSFRTEFYYEQKCKTYYCHPCMIKIYDHYCDITQQMEMQSGVKIDLPVDLTCGCDIDKEVILRYLRPYCYECSKKLYGSSILLKNQCRMQMECVQRLKRNAEYFREPEAVSKWSVVKQSLIICMNCDKIIDGDIKPIGNQIDGMYVCSIRLDLTEINEKLYSSRMKSHSSYGKKAQNKQQMKNGKEAVKSPIQLKPQLLNGKKYHQTRCKKCNVGIEILNGQQSLCEMCVQVKQPIPAKGPPQPIRQSTIEKEQVLTSDKKLLKLANQLKINGKKQIVIEQKQQKMPLLDDHFQQVEKSEKQQAKQQYNQLLKRNIQTQLKQQNDEQDLNELEQMKYNKRQSSINQEFLPLQVQVLSINIDKSTQNKCQKCNYIIQDYNYYKTYQKDDENPQSLRIAQTQQQTAKQQKQHKIVNVCSNCFFNFKWKLKLAQQKRKRQKQLQYSSSRYRSVPKRPKMYEPLAATFTNVKKVQEKRKQKAIEYFCFTCLKRLPQAQFSTFDSKQCKKCVLQSQKKIQTKVACKGCYRQFVKEKDSDPNLKCLSCRYATQSIGWEVQKRPQAKVKCRRCTNQFVKEKNSSSQLLMCSSCQYATQLTG